MSVKIHLAPIDAPWPRRPTPDGERRQNPFRSALAATLADLRREVDALGADAAVVQTAHRPRDFRRDGTGFMADAGPPEHPGVLVSFRGVHGPLRFACDACRRWRDNLRAVVLTLERLRLADLYGVTSSGEQYRGWSALPPPGGSTTIVTPPPMTVEEAARVVAGPEPGQQAQFAPILRDRDAFQRAYRERAKALHPDRNDGRHLPEWAELQAAKSLLDEHHRAAAGRG